MTEGVRSTHIEQASMVDEVLANVTVDGIARTARMPVAALGTQIAQSAGAIVAKQVKANLAQLDAVKSTMSAGDVGLVMFDPDLSKRGQYALEGGVLIRKADLTETQAEFWAGQAKFNADRVDLGALDQAVIDAEEAGAAQVALATGQAGIATQKASDAQAAVAAIQLISPGAVVGAATNQQAIEGVLLDKAMNPPNTHALLNDRFGNLRAKVLSPESGWVWALVDAADNIALAVATNGKVWFSPQSELRIPVGNLGADVTSKLLNGLLSTQFAKPESGWLLVCTDAADNIAWGVKTDGTFWAKLAADVAIPQAIADGIAASVLASVNNSIAGFFPVSTITVWGDSMTQGAGGSGTSITTVMAAALGRTVNNRGIGGQDATGIAVRSGAWPLTLTLSGNAIPASGGVAVTGKSVNILYSGGTYTGTAHVTILGIAGLLSTDASGNWTFTRTTAGDVTAVPANTPAIITDTGTAFIPAPGPRRGDTTLAWSGRNGARSTRAEIVATRERILAQAAYLTPKQRRLLVVSVCNGGSGADGNTNEGSGTSAYTQIANLNSELAATFGNNFVDLRSYMVKQAIYDAIAQGLLSAPTANDNADIAADAIPASLRSDSIHFNSIGYTMAGQFLSRQIIARGW